MEKDKKWDKGRYSPHQYGDVDTRNINIEEGNVLCKRCAGTGNELFSMYRRCEECHGTGIKEHEKLIKKVKLVAYIDINEVGLDVEYDDEVIAEIPWPSNWPEVVDKDFLEKSGFEVVW